MSKTLERTQWKTLEGEKTMETREMKKLDLKQYIGTESTIGSAKIVSTQYGLAVVVKSKKLAEISADKDLVASVILGFTVDKDEEDKTPYIGIDSKLDLFLKSKGLVPADLMGDIVEDGEITELYDKPVVVQLNKKSSFLDLV